MSLLSVTVKRAKFAGPNANQLNTYVTLQLQNVKSTTITVKGASPAWEQDFLFETNRLDTGLLIEVWNKGLIWDKVLGHYWLPLHQVPYSSQEGTGVWMSLDAEQIMEQGVVVGTRNPTGDHILLDCRFELPYDMQDVDTSDMQRKLEAYNHVLDQEMATLGRADINRRQQFLTHSGLSEDSDYTSDISYPLNHQANGSASQYLAVAHQYPSPQQFSDISRQNSYDERDDHQLTHPQQPVQWGHNQSYDGYDMQTAVYPYSYEQNEMYTDHSWQEQQQQQQPQSEEPLYYNSRPKDFQTPRSLSNNSETDARVNGSTASEARVLAHGNPAAAKAASLVKGKGTWKPSLERQSTLYDEHETESNFNECFESAYAPGCETEYDGNYIADYDIGYAAEYSIESEQFPHVGDSKGALVPTDPYENETSYANNDHDWTTNTSAYVDQQQEPSDQQQSGDYYYNYEYSEAGGVGDNYITEYDTGKSTHGYGYYDDTGYYYDGQWYSYTDEQYPGYDDQTNVTNDTEYDYSIDLVVSNAAYEESIAADEPLAVQPVVSKSVSTTAAAAALVSSPSNRDSGTATRGSQLPTGDVTALKRRTLMQGDLSSSGGSAESEYLNGMLNLRRLSSTSVATPTTDLQLMESSMGELDRLESDLVSSRTDEYQKNDSMALLRTGMTDSRMSDRRMGKEATADSPMDPRRSSVQSHLSQLSRRERQEEFRRRRSSSIDDHEQEFPPNIESPYGFFDDNERTPVNEPHRLSGEFNDLTPVNSSIVGGPSGKMSAYIRDDSSLSTRKSVSFEEGSDKCDPLVQPVTPLSVSGTTELTPIISAPPTDEDRPKLTARQRWLWAFNKICVQIMVSDPVT